MKIIEYALRLFFPPKCLYCNKILKIDTSIPYCEKCFDTLREGKIFSLVENTPQNVDVFYAFYSYDNECAKHSVFHAKKLFSPLFSDYYKSLCQTLFSTRNLAVDIDLITFATRRKSEEQKEGIDQAREMAKIVSKVTGIKCHKTLKRTRKSKKQRNLSPKERAENVKNLFACTRDLTGMRVLIVDDVITTGSTISDCARALKEKGAIEVRVLSFCC